MKEFIEKLAKKYGINDIENTRYDFDSTKYWRWSNELTTTNIRSFQYRKLPHKKIYPNGDKIGGGNLFIFDVIWSDDLSLAPALLLDFPSNQYKNFRYRLLPKQLGEKYQYVYEI